MRSTATADATTHCSCKPDKEDAVCSSAHLTGAALQVNPAGRILVAMYSFTTKPLGATRLCT